MLAVRSLLKGLGLERNTLPAAASYTTKVVNDYSLVLKQASEVGNAVKVPEKEVGLCTGAPLDSYTRKVGLPSCVIVLLVLMQVLIMLAPYGSVPRP